MARSGLPDETAEKAYKRMQAEIASLLDWIECELTKDADEEITWASFGSLAKVKQDLKETLEFLSNVPTDQIERSLEELHTMPTGRQV